MPFLIHYLYNGGESPFHPQVISAEQLFGLYQIASEWGISALQQYIEQVFIQTLDEDNITTLVSVTEQHSALHAIALDYATQHAEMLQSKLDQISNAKLKQDIHDHVEVHSPVEFKKKHCIVQ